VYDFYTKPYECTGIEAKIPSFKLLFWDEFTVAWPSSLARESGELKPSAGQADDLCQTEHEGPIGMTFTTRYPDLDPGQNIAYGPGESETLKATHKYADMRQSVPGDKFIGGPVSTFGTAGQESNIHLCTSPTPLKMDKFWWDAYKNVLDTMEFDENGNLATCPQTVMSSADMQDMKMGTANIARVQNCIFECIGMLGKNGNPEFNAAEETDCKKKCYAAIFTPLSPLLADTELSLESAGEFDSLQRDDKVAVEKELDSSGFSYLILASILLIAGGLLACRSQETKHDPLLKDFYGGDEI